MGILDLPVAMSNDIPYARVKSSLLATANMPITLDQMIRGEEKSTGPLDLTQYISRVSDHPIAQGGYGDIWKCILTIPVRDGCRESPQVVAVKAIRSHMLDDHDRVKKDKRLRRELLIWQRLAHKNILPLYGVTFGFGQFTAMVCPWAENGSLTSYLESHPGLSVLLRFNLLSDIASGLHYLHSNQVVHGDLTGSNVLVMDDVTACLSDFGLSGVISDFLGASNFSSTLSSNARWGAPELFAIPDVQDDTFTNRPTKEADIYSFGSIMLQILSGNVPYYYVKRPIQIILMVVNGKTPTRPEGIADDHWNTIQSCWKQPSSDRPCSKDILSSITAQRNLLQS